MKFILTMELGTKLFEPQQITDQTLSKLFLHINTTTTISPVVQLKLMVMKLPLSLLIVKSQIPKKLLWSFILKKLLQPLKCQQVLHISCHVIKDALVIYCTLLHVRMQQGASDSSFKKLSCASFGKLNAIWNKVDRSTTAAEIIKEGCGMQLIRPCQTRWNSFYSAAERIVSIRKAKGKEALNHVFQALNIRMWEIIGVILDLTKYLIKSSLQIRYLIYSPFDLPCTGP